MTRYIDANALYELGHYDDFDEYVVDWKTIDNAPTADVVSVVRCKDCKWYKTNYSWNGKEHKVCVIEPYEPVRKGDDYCSYGERAEEVERLVMPSSDGSTIKCERREDDDRSMPI